MTNIAPNHFNAVRNAQRKKQKHISECLPCVRRPWAVILRWVSRCFVIGSWIWTLARACWTIITMQTYRYDGTWNCSHKVHHHQHRIEGCRRLSTRCERISYTVVRKRYFIVPKITHPSTSIFIHSERQSNLFCMITENSVAGTGKNGKRLAISKASPLPFCVCQNQTTERRTHTHTFCWSTWISIEKRTAAAVATGFPFQCHIKTLSSLLNVYMDVG